MFMHPSLPLLRGFKTLPYLSVAPQLSSINTSWIEPIFAGSLNSMAGSPRDNWGTCDKLFQPAGKENMMGRKMRFDFSASSCFEGHRRWRLAGCKPVSNPPEHIHRSGPRWAEKVRTHTWEPVSDQMWTCELVDELLKVQVDSTR